jgi:very-short-patch-repair endonuclease
VVDFYCFQHRLAIELDGTAHAQPSQELKDREKDTYLKRLGIRVLRLPNGIVLKDDDAFLRKIVESLQ